MRSLRSVIISLCSSLESSVGRRSILLHQEIGNGSIVALAPRRRPPSSSLLFLSAALTLTALPIADDEILFLPPSSLNDPHIFSPSLIEKTSQVEQSGTKWNWGQKLLALAPYLLD